VGHHLDAVQAPSRHALVVRRRVAPRVVEETRLFRITIDTLE